MFPDNEALRLMYSLCDRHDDCERGSNHEGECGPCACSTPHEGSCTAEAERLADRAAMKESKS